MATEGLCAVDYVLMVLLDKFKGKAEIGRLESHLNKYASDDIKAIVHCTGGLRGFLESQSDSFDFDSTNVTCKEGRKPSKESDVIKWFRGRLKTSPRKFFSIQALQKIIKNGPPGINSYFSFTCPTSEKLQEWFLQRSQIFKESLVGNILLSDCNLSPSDNSTAPWCCIDFFVKILDEQGCENLSVDWACLFNYVFVSDNPLVLSYITSRYEEATFENFFKDNAIQFGLELHDGQLCRSSDPANSGLEVVLNLPVTTEQPIGEYALVSCIDLCKNFLSDEASMPVSELRKSFDRNASKALRDFMHNVYPKEQFKKFLTDNEKVFTLSPDGQLVSLNVSRQILSVPSKNTARLERNSKYDEILHGVFRDLLIMASREQGLRFVDVQQLGHCVQLMPKYVANYFTQTYSPTVNFFKGNEIFRFVENQSEMVGLKEKTHSEDSSFNHEAVATLTLNFFVQAFSVFARYGVKFVPPSQLEMLSCGLANSSVREYIEANFGSRNTQLKNLLKRFPEIFVESRAGNLSLRNLNIDRNPFESSNEVLTNAKALCENPMEASAAEFYLRSISDVSSQCYPVPMWWCTEKVFDAPRHVSSFLKEGYPCKDLGLFFDKFPNIFFNERGAAVVYLQAGFRPNSDDSVPAATEAVCFVENEEIIFGFLAGLCLAKCGPISTSDFFSMAEKHFLMYEVDAVLEKRIGQTPEDKLCNILEQYPMIVSFEQKNEPIISLRWAYQFRSQLRKALEQTLCRVVRNCVVVQADETGLFPTIGEVFDQLQSSLAKSFGNYLRTLTDFLELLDKFMNIFIVNGSTNTIIVKDYSVRVEFTPEISPLSGSGAPYARLGDGASVSSVAPLSVSSLNDVIQIKSWIDQRKQFMSTWSSLGTLVDRFVSQMDLQTATQFAAVHGLANGLKSVLKEIERLMKVNAVESAVQMMGLYQEKNTVFFSELLSTVTKVVSFIVKDKTCAISACGCQKLVNFTSFEAFVDFCSLIRLHLEQGPLARILTPSSSGSNASTPEILDRFSQWCDSEGSHLNLVLEDKSLEEVQMRLFDQSNYRIWGLNAKILGQSTCWPKNIWEPRETELNAACQDVSSLTFRVSSVKSRTVTADAILGTGKLEVDWPQGMINIGDELTVTVRSKR